MKPLNSGHLRVLKICPLLRDVQLLGISLIKIVTLGTKHFARCSRHVHYLGCPLLGGLTVLFTVNETIYRQRLMKFINR